MAGWCVGAQDRCWPWVSCVLRSSQRRYYLDLVWRSQAHPAKRHRSRNHILEGLPRAITIRNLRLPMTRRPLRCSGKTRNLRRSTSTPYRRTATRRNSCAPPQLHAVLLQGMALAGFNVIDLDGLHEALDIPVLVVARRALTWARSAVRSSTRSREERESGASSNKPARWNRSRAYLSSAGAFRFARRRRF